MTSRYTGTQQGLYDRRRIRGQQDRSLERYNAEQDALKMKAAEAVSKALLDKRTANIAESEAHLGIKSKEDVGDIAEGTNLYTDTRDTGATTIGGKFKQGVDNLYKNVTGKYVEQNPEALAQVKSQATGDLTQTDQMTQLYGSTAAREYMNKFQGERTSFSPNMPEIKQGMYKGTDPTMDYSSLEGITPHQYDQQVERAQIMQNSGDPGVGVRSNFGQTAGNAFQTSAPVRDSNLATSGYNPSNAMLNKIEDDQEVTIDTEIDLEEDPQGMSRGWLRSKKPVQSMGSGSERGMGFRRGLGGEGDDILEDSIVPDDVESRDDLSALGVVPDSNTLPSIEEGIKEEAGATEVADIVEKKADMETVTEKISKNTRASQILKGAGSVKGAADTISIIASDDKTAEEKLEAGTDLVKKEGGKAVSKQIEKQAAKETNKMAANILAEKGVENITDIVARQAAKEASKAAAQAALSIPASVVTGTMDVVSGGEEAGAAGHRGDEVGEVFGKTKQASGLTSATGAVVTAVGLLANLIPVVGQGISATLTPIGVGMMKAGTIGSLASSGGQMASSAAMSKRGSTIGRSYKKKFKDIGDRYA